MSKATKLFTAAIIIIAILVAAFVVWQDYSDQKPTANNTPNDSSINYGPPTQAQKQAAGTNHKDSGTSDTTSPSANSTSSSAPKQNVNVTITTWAEKHGDITVNGYVEGVVETGGTCTLTLTKGDVTRSASRPAAANATNTTCGENDIPTSQLTPGTWTAVLSYSSAKYTGQSGPVSVEVNND